MKKIFLMSLCSGLLAFASTVSANIITDNITFSAADASEPENLISYGGSSVNELEHVMDWVKWRHVYDFNPLAESINSATLSLTFEDDDNNWLGKYDWPLEWGAVYEEGNPYLPIWINEIDPGSYDINARIEKVKDGDFTVLLRSVSPLGDFTLNQSVLTIDYKPVAEAVPEPSALLLLGLGSLMIGFVRTRRKK